MKKTIALILILFTGFSVFAEQPVRQHHPKIGLVLSGGGARGAAHIGVIEALEEMNVPIDLIVGTSMGAVIGGLYASGVPIQKIKSDFSTLNWNQIFSYNINRDDLYFRRKLDSDLFLIKNFIRYSNGKIRIPYGIITGQALYEVFNSYLLPLQPIRNFSDLAIPFKAVSTDLITGKAIVLDQGDLALSLLASMAVPGIISPIDTNGYLLVDGGVSCNLPVEVAKSMGADILIVVDVGTPLSTKAEIVDLTGVLGQLTNLMTHQNIERSTKLLTAHDILLEPKLTNIETAEFVKFAQGIEPGKISALQHSSQLRALSRPSARGRVAGYATRTPEIRIDQLSVINEKSIKPATYFYYLDFDSEYVSANEIKEHIDKLYGLSLFDRIYYNIEENQNVRTLVVEPKINKADPVYIQGSILLDSDFETTNTFGFVVGITNQQANSMIGEWRIIAQIGQGEGLLAEYYQPITDDLTWFINPVISIQRTPFTAYSDYNPLAVYINTTNTAAFSFGKLLSNWGRIRGYWEFENNDLKRRTGAPLIPEGHISDGEVGISFEWDTIDNLYFPHHGLRGHARLSSNDKAYGGETHFSQLDIASLAGFSAGKHALALGAKYNRTLEDTPSYPAKFSLGGLYELTGLYSGELIGDNSALISAIYFYEIKQIQIIPNRPSPVYIGASLEEGKVWGNTNLDANRFIGSASLFVAIDSMLGPFYLAVGATDTGRKAAHLTLRPAFR